MRFQVSLLLSLAPFKPRNKHLTCPNFYLLLSGFLFG